MYFEREREREFERERRGERERLGSPLLRCSSSRGRSRRSGERERLAGEGSGLRAWRGGDR